MNENLFIDVRLARKQFRRQELEDVTDADLKKINSLTRNGPLRELKKEDINTRSIIILGEEPTTKMSIHPEGDINGRQIKSLSQISRLLPGSPMMIGHRMDKEPWGRTFDSEVLGKGALPGYTGSCLHEKYWFLADEEGNGIARKIDAGIWSEGSISYWFKEARCSICHKPMQRGWFGTESGCEHKIGEKDEATGQVCYWYPYKVLKVAETSYVFAGAYQKTRSMLHADGNLLKECYSSDEIESGKRLEETLVEYGLNPEKMIVDFENSQNDVNPNNKDGENATQNSEGCDEGTDKGVKPQVSSQSGDTGTQSGTEEPGKSENAAGQEGLEGEKAGEENSNRSGENNGAERNSTDENGEAGDSENSGKEASAEQEGNSNQNSESQESQKPGEVNAQAKEEAGGKEGTSSEGSEKTDHDAGSADSASGAGSDASNNVTPGEDGKSVSKLNVENETQVSINKMKNDDSEQETPKKCLEIENRFDTQVSRNKDGVYSGSGSSATVSFLSSLTEEQISEVNSILDDATLDDDEKETAVKEFLNGETELINVVLAEWSNIRRREEKEEKLRVCAVCHNEESQGGACDDCGGELIDVLQFANRLFKPVGPVRPKKSGSINNEFFQKEDFRDLPSGEYIVEPSYDGLWMEIHRSGDTVKIYTENGIDYSEKFPAIVSEVKGSKSDNFVLVGNMTRWRGRKRLTCEDVTNYIHSDQEEYDDKEFKFKPSDIIVKSGKDISGETLSIRRKILDESIEWGKQIQPTAIARVKHEKGGGEIVAAIVDRKTREGAIVKNSDSKYTLNDQSKLYEWKQQLFINCRVAKAIPKDTGGVIYECEIGRGNAVLSIGKTFPTELSANEGDVIKVSVDSVRYNEETEKYTWIAPKVISLKTDKKLADPVSSGKRIADMRKSEDRSKNIITLTEVLPKLKKASIDFELFLVGGIVENGLTTGDLNLLVCKELTEEENDIVLTALGERISPYTDITVNKNGPEGASIKVVADMAENGEMGKFFDKFVIQRHGWGKDEHWDIRFGAAKTPRLFGYTCFEEPTNKIGGKKVRCQEKKYHDPKWLSVNDKKIGPGNPGNPSKNFNAHMIIEDEGTFKLIRNTDSFLEVELEGEKYKGRYLFRQIDVKQSENSSSYKIDGDEVAPRNEKIWFMWKPKEQIVNSPVKKIAFKIIEGATILWESDEIDKEIEDK